MAQDEASIRCVLMVADGAYRLAATHLNEWASQGDLARAQFVEEQHD